MIIKHKKRIRSGEKYKNSQHSVQVAKHPISSILQPLESFKVSFGREAVKRALIFDKTSLTRDFHK
jgi:hypothetical protein